jgi:phosphoserine phosphatase
MKTKLIILDMDGVLFEGDNFWLDLHRQYGTEKEGLKLAEEFMDSNYTQLGRIVVRRLWKGKPASTFERLIKERSYQPRVRSVFEFLHHNKIRSAIVSSGPYQLAERAQRELGIDIIRANRLEIQNGVISDIVDIMVREGDKGRIGLELISSLGATPSQTAFVGDSDGDVGLAEVVGLPIAYNSKSARLNKLCQHALPYGEFEKIVPILKSSL